MADVASLFGAGGLAWAQAGLTDNMFLCHFDLLFPLPQMRSWRGFCLVNKIPLRVISVLRGEKLVLELWS